MNHSMPGLPVHHQLQEFTQTHVRWVSDAIQPSHPLSSPSPPPLNLSQHQDLFKWVSSSHQVGKVLEFQLQHQSFQWTPRTYLLQDGLVGSPCSPRDSQESSPTPPEGAALATFEPVVPWEPSTWTRLSSQTILGAAHWALQEVRNIDPPLLVKQLHNRGLSFTVHLSCVPVSKAVLTGKHYIIWGQIWFFWENILALFLELSSNVNVNIVSNMGSGLDEIVK